MRPEDRIICPGCGATDWDIVSQEEVAYIHRKGCPVDYEPNMGVELPDGSRGLYGHEVAVFGRGAKWAQEKIAENLEKRAESFDRASFPIEAAGYRRAAQVVRESAW